MTELELARQAMAGGDDVHALHHLAGALAEAPMDERVLAALAEVSARVDVLAKVPAEGFVGNVVLRAWALQRAGAPEGLGLLAQAAEALPTRGFEVVLASWLTARHAAGQPLPEAERQQCCRMLADALRSTIGLHRLWPGERALLSGFVECARALAAFPPDEVTTLVVSALLRRAGLLGEALQVTAAGAERGDPQSLRAHGLTLRALGRGVEAAGLFARLEALEPDRVELLEQARSWFVARDGNRALAHLARAGVEADEELVALEALARQPPPEDPVGALDQVRRRALGHGWLAPRTDATANGLRQAAGQVLGRVSIAVSGWESPSNRLALALVSGLGDRAVEADYSASAVTLDFDPFAGACEARLWAEEGGIVSQAVPAPPASVLEAVRRVAQVDGDGLALFEAAGREAKAFTERDATLFAHAMVRLPDGHPVDPDALYRWQCAAAAMLARLPGPPDGPGGRLLAALAHGQVDWTASAAVYALAQWGRADADAARFCRDALLETVSRLVPHGCEPRVDQLAAALHTLPTVPAETLAALSAWQRRHGPEEEGATEDGEDPPAEAGASGEATPAPAGPATPAAVNSWLQGAPLALLVAAVCLGLVALLRACGP